MRYLQFYQQLRIYWISCFDLVRWSNTNVVSYYNSIDADKYKAYLTALINNLYNTNQVINDWTNNRDTLLILQKHIYFKFEFDY